VAISNERIAGVHNGEVAFRVRVNGAAGKKRTIRLDGAAFIGRFLLHLLPKGFKRIRHYGLLGPAHKATHLAAARAALHAPQPQPMVIESVAQFMRRVARIEWAACPHCGPCAPRFERTLCDPRYATQLTTRYAVLQSP